MVELVAKKRVPNRTDVFEANPERLRVDNSLDSGSRAGKFECGNN